MEERLIYKDHDRDSDQDTWKKYNIIYKKEFGDLFDFNLIEDKETSSKCPRCYIRFNSITKPELAEKYPRFSMAGDTIFNFKKKSNTAYRQNGKYETYENLLSESNQIDELEHCHYRYHDFENFSFMPITGGLQGVKQIYAQDRFDKFVVLLKQYYDLPKGERDKHIFITYRKGYGRGKICVENKEALKAFLGKFDNHFEYCKKIYFINESFVEELILQGCKPINNGKRVIEYMKLAKDYWEIRKKYIESLRTCLD